MSTSSTLPVRRLLLALDASDFAADDVTLAIELAALIGLELHGIFVEDSDLLRLAELPFAREVGARSGQDRPMARESMESILRRRVARMASELARAGKLRNVPVSHDTARGKRVRQALKSGEQGDLVLLTPSARARRFERTGARGTGPVMIWCDDERSAAASFAVAVPLARRLRTGLLVGIPAASYRSESEARARLAELLLRAPGPVTIHVVADPSARSFIETARAQRVAQLVLPSATELASTATLERLLDELGATVILVR